MMTTMTLKYIFNDFDVICETNKAKLLSPPGSIVYTYAYPSAVALHHRLLCRWLQNSNEYCLLLRLALAEFGFYLAIFVTVCGMFVRKYVSISRTLSYMIRYTTWTLFFVPWASITQKRARTKRLATNFAPDIFRLIKNDKTSVCAIFLRWQTMEVEEQQRWLRFIYDGFMFIVEKLYNKMISHKS